MAGDIVGLGIIKSFGRWGMVRDKDVWEQRQIKRALELGIGSRKGDIILRTEEGNQRFQELMKSVRGLTGLA